MEMLFFDIPQFNEDISGWDTSKATSMRKMFQVTNGVNSFNQDISGWDTSRVTNMDYMFYNTVAFSQDLSSWCVERVSSVYAFKGHAASNADTDPVWGGGNCPTACSTGADGNPCQNSGIADGFIPYGSWATDTCSCICAG
jgi:surface protein